MTSFSEQKRRQKAEQKAQKKTDKEKPADEAAISEKVAKMEVKDDKPTGEREAEPTDPHVCKLFIVLRYLALCSIV